MLNMIHHTHHNSDGSHTVHHCGGNHSDPYTITHCKCGLHSIDIEYFKSNIHGPNEFSAIIRFTSKCPEGGWHIESGKVY